MADLSFAVELQEEPRGRGVRRSDTQEVKGPAQEDSRGLKVREKEIEKSKEDHMVSRHRFARTRHYTYSEQEVWYRPHRRYSLLSQPVIFRQGSLACHDLGRLRLSVEIGSLS